MQLGLLAWVHELHRLHALPLHHLSVSLRVHPWGWYARWHPNTRRHTLREARGGASAIIAAAYAAERVLESWVQAPHPKRWRLLLRWWLLLTVLVVLW